MSHNDSSVPIPPLRRSLEEALAENPDDLAGHHAYADYLQEQGDPRGEFIAVQLALEEPGRSAAERKQLQAREVELLQIHAKTWLGDVGRFLVGEWSGPEKPFHFAFRRGWLDHVRILPMPDAVLLALAKCPEARLLSRLEVIYDMRYHPFDFDQFVTGPAQAMREDEGNFEDVTYFDGNDLNDFRAVMESPYLTNLRSLTVGFGGDSTRIVHSTMVGPIGNCTSEGVLKLLARCPQLEELCINGDMSDVGSFFAHASLGQLRILQYYFGIDDYNHSTDTRTPAYPLERLAANPALTQLTTLRLHPGRESSIDAEQAAALFTSPHLPALEHLQIRGIREIGRIVGDLVKSGILRRLRTLDLGSSSLTDVGARQLAECPDIRHLESLNLTNNALSAEGITALEATGVRLIADEQHDPSDRYYFYVDVE
jgi:uncharacterized protein (TIGR02996 family)